MTWSAGDVEWFEGVAAKRAAADALRSVSLHDADVVAWEWKSDDREHILMLEHHC